MNLETNSIASSQFSTILKMVRAVPEIAKAFPGDCWSWACDNKLMACLVVGYKSTYAVPFVVPSHMSMAATAGLTVAAVPVAVDWVQSQVTKRDAFWKAMERAGHVAIKITAGFPLKP